MALDTKQKRGSAMCLGLPFRQWLAEPSGIISAGSRISLVKLGSAVSAAAPNYTTLSGLIFAKPSLGGRIRSE